MGDGAEDHKDMVERGEDQEWDKPEGKMLTEQELLATKRLASALGADKTAKLIDSYLKLQAQNKVMREGLEKIFRPECCWCGVDQEHDENCAFVLARQTLQRVKEVEDAPGS